MNSSTNFSNLKDYFSSNTRNLSSIFRQSDQSKTKTNQLQITINQNNKQDKSSINLF